MKKHIISICLIAFCAFLSAQQQNIFSGRFTKAELEKIIISQDKWQPFPKIADRKAWESIDSTQMKQLVKKAESQLNYNFQGIPATVTLLFQRTGDRQQYEKSSFTKRTVLSNLLLAELYENKGRFMDQIVNGVWSICEESYWGIPAHLNQWHAGAGLPDTSDPYVDLFSAETAAILSWIDYFVGDKLDAISPQIRKRIYNETNQRIFTPLTTNNHPWMGFNKAGRRPNNWNPWICSNWLNTALLLEKDENKRAKMLEKIMLTLDQYLNPYPQDGGCDEGPSYWAVAHASLFDNVELLNLATNNSFEYIYANQRFKNMGQFIYKAQIGSEYFLNFADAPPKVAVPADLVYRYGKAIDDKNMMGFGAYYQKDSITIDRVFIRTLFEIFNHNALSKITKNLPLPKDAWYPDIQVMMARDNEGSSNGFYLAAKGGNNDESHNHNDIGNFVVYYDGMPVLIDIGKGTYTAKTFSNQRYEIWSNTSDYHNIPTINGKQQLPGAAFKATNVNYTNGNKVSQIVLDIAKAYPENAGIKSWQRTVKLVRGNEVQLTDNILLTKFDSVSQHFMTCFPVEIGKKGEVIIHANGKDFQIEYDSKSLQATIEKVEMNAPEDNGVIQNWGNSIYRINFSYKKKTLKSIMTYQIKEK
ncbi:MAG: heparinase II/III family protein [Paludibacter sp.]